MPQVRVDLPPGQWVDVTGANITSVSFQNTTGAENTPVYVIPGGTSAPNVSGVGAAFMYLPGMGEVGMTIGSLISGATRVWMISPTGRASVSVWW